MAMEVPVISILATRISLDTYLFVHDISKVLSFLNVEYKPLASMVPTFVSLHGPTSSSHVL